MFKFTTQENDEEANVNKFLLKTVKRMIMIKRTARLTAHQNVNLTRGERKKL